MNTTEAAKLSSYQNNILRSAMSDLIATINRVAPNVPVTIHLSPDDTYCSIEHYRDNETGVVTREPKHLHKVIFNL